MFLLLFLFQNLCNLVSHSLQFLDPRLQDFGRYDAMSDLVFTRAVFDSCFEHLSVRLANERHRARIRFRYAVYGFEKKVILPSSFTSTGCSSDTVKILRELGWHVIVNHCFDALDIQTTRSEVCSHQIVDGAFAEGMQCFQTLLLTLENEND